MARGESPTFGTTLAPSLPHLCASGLSGSAKRHALDRDAVEEPTLAGIVVERIVPSAAIVPEGQRPRAPLESAGELRPCRMLVEVLQERTRLLVGPVDEADGEGRINVEGLASRAGVTDDHRMDRILGRRFGIRDPV